MFYVVVGQNTEKPNADMFNTSSCLEKPFRCPHPKIRFFLYTRNTQERGEEINVLDQESLWNSNWNPKYPVKILIHGKLIGNIIHSQ